MTPETFKSIRKRLGLSQSELAQVLRLGNNAGRYVRMLESGDRAPSGPVCYLMELLDAGVIQPQSQNSTMSAER